MEYIINLIWKYWGLVKSGMKFHCFLVISYFPNIRYMLGHYESIGISSNGKSWKFDSKSWLGRYYRTSSINNQLYDVNLQWHPYVFRTENFDHHAGFSRNPDLDEVVYRISGKPKLFLMRDRWKVLWIDFHSDAER
jgi:hypothetical protein